MTWEVDRWNMQTRSSRGKFIQQNEQQKYAEAFAIKDGRILAIGSKEEIKQYLGADTDVKEYTNGIILPDFQKVMLMSVQRLNLLSDHWWKLKVLKKQLP